MSGGIEQVEKRPATSVTISISARRATRYLIILVLCLSLLSVLGSVSKYVPLQGRLAEKLRGSFIRLFSLDEEANVPTWYSSSLLLLCSGLLAAITIAKKRDHDRHVPQWGALAIIFLYLSLDETAIIHEMAIEPLRAAFHLSGVFYYGWVIPAAAAVLVFGLAYFRFLTALPPRTRWLFLTAGAVFVTGALVVESASGWYASAFGERGLRFEMITTAEELLEMLGTVAFIYALLDYIASHVVQVHLHVGAGAPSPRPRERRRQVRVYRRPVSNCFDKR